MKLENSFILFGVNVILMEEGWGKCLNSLESGDGVAENLRTSSPGLRLSLTRKCQRLWYFVGVVFKLSKFTRFLKPAGFPLDLENLEKWESTWKTWKYHGILWNLINIMEKWRTTWKNFVATKNSPWTPRFGSPSIQFMIIFQKNFQPRFARHKYYLSIVF